MLKDLLREIGEAKVFSKTNLAKDLNISEIMVDDFIAQLVRMGYLREDLGSPTCESYCGKCPYARACNINPVKIYHVSEKGRRFLQ